MNALQPPQQVLHIPALPMPNAMATNNDLLHADSYVDAMVVARWGESLVSVQTVLVCSIVYRWCSYTG